MDKYACLEKIPISDGFPTLLHICAVVQTQQIYKKPIQTLNKLRTIEGGKQLHGNRAWPLNNRLRASAR